MFLVPKVRASTRKLGKRILSAFCMLPKADRQQAEAVIAFQQKKREAQMAKVFSAWKKRAETARKVEAFRAKRQAACTGPAFWAWRMHVGVTTFYQQCIKMEQDRRMLRAWHDYAKQRRQKKAASSPSITSERSTDIQSSIPTPLSIEMDAACRTAGNGPKGKTMGVPAGVHSKGLGLAAGTHSPIVALEAICA